MRAEAGEWHFAVRPAGAQEPLCQELVRVTMAQGVAPEPEAAGAAVCA